MSRMKQTSVMRLAMLTRILCNLYSKNVGRWDSAEDVGRRRCGNCWSKQALDSGGVACCAQRGTIKALCWGTLKWQFHGRTKIHRCVQTEILLKTDLSLAKHRQPRLEVAEIYCQVTNRNQGIKEWIQGLHPNYIPLVPTSFSCSERGQRDYESEDSLLFTNHIRRNEP